MVDVFQRREFLQIFRRCVFGMKCRALELMVMHETRETDVNKKWLVIGVLIVIGAIGFSEFHSINTKNQIEDDLIKAQERLKNAKQKGSQS